MTQFSVFLAITLFIAWLTYRKCREAGARGESAKEYFLAGGGLSWFFLAGSLTLTNINTDTLGGWNGNQVLVIIWWELAGVVGLILLAKVFLPIYYRYNCTTVTELLERRYNNKHLRATVASMFLVGNLLVFLPIMLYTTSLFLTAVFGLEIPLMLIAISIAIAGAAYAIFGGLRAFAVSDTYSGVLLFTMAILVVILAMNAVSWDLSDLPLERLALFGELGDASYGTVVSAVLPQWLSGAFAAAMVAAAMTSFNSALNSSAALYVCDLHLMFITIWACVGFALAVNALFLGGKAVPVWRKTT